MPARKLYFIAENKQSMRLSFQYSKIKSFFLESSILKYFWYENI